MTWRRIAAANSPYPTNTTSVEHAECARLDRNAGQIMRDLQKLVANRAIAAARFEPATSGLGARSMGWRGTLMNSLLGSATSAPPASGQRCRGRLAPARGRRGDPPSTGCTSAANGTPSIALGRACTGISTRPRSRRTGTSRGAASCDGRVPLSTVCSAASCRASGVGLGARAVTVAAPAVGSEAAAEAAVARPAEP
jgi:hypothetical protein